MPPKPTAPPAKSTGKSPGKEAQKSPEKGGTKASKSGEKSSSLPKINSPKAAAPSPKSEKLPIDWHLHSHVGPGRKKSKDEEAIKMPNIDAPANAVVVDETPAPPPDSKGDPPPTADQTPPSDAAAVEAMAAAKAAEEAKAALELEQQRIAQEELAKKQNGNVTLKYEMYSELFPITNGSLTAAVIDEAYCLSFVMPQCLIHLSVHDPPTKLAMDAQGQLDYFLPENTTGTYHGLEADNTYYVYIEQEADQLARDQAKMREVAATMEGAMSSKGNNPKKDDGRGFESCSCIEGNPCVDEYGCKDWYNRYAVATKNGWKGF